MPRPLTKAEAKRRADRRIFEEWREYAATDFAIEILGGLTPGTEEPRMLRLAKKILDSEDIDLRIQADMFKTLLQMKWGRPGEAKPAAVSDNAPGVTLTGTLSMDEWKAKANQLEEPAPKA